MDLRISGDIDNIQSPALLARCNSESDDHIYNHYIHNNNNNNIHHITNRHNHSHSIDYSDHVIYNTDCSVCLSGLCDVLLLPCSHKFHSGCILTWVNTNNNKQFYCPTCRTHIQQFIPIDVYDNTSSDNSDSEYNTTTQHNTKLRSNSIYARRRIKLHRRNSLEKCVPIANVQTLTKNWSINDFSNINDDINSINEVNSAKSTSSNTSNSSNLSITSRQRDQSARSTSSNNISNKTTLKRSDTHDSIFKPLQTGEFAVLQRYDENSPSLHNTPSAKQLRDWFSQQIRNEHNVNNNRISSIATTHYTYSRSASPEPYSGNETTTNNTIDFAHLLAAQLRDDHEHNEQHTMKQFLTAWNKHYVVKRNVSHNSLTNVQHNSTTTDDDHDHDRLIKTTPLSYIDTDKLNNNISNGTATPTETLLSNFINKFNYSSLKNLTNITKDEIINVSKNITLIVEPAWKTAINSPLFNINNKTKSAMTRSNTMPMLSNFKLQQQDNNQQPTNDNSNEKARSELVQFILFARDWILNRQQQKVLLKQQHINQLRNTLLPPLHPVTITRSRTQQQENKKRTNKRKQSKVYASIQQQHTQHRHDDNAHHSTISSSSTSDRATDTSIKPSAPVGAMLDHHHHAISGLFAGTVAAGVMNIVQPSTGLTVTQAAKLALKTTIPSVSIYFSTYEHVKCLLDVHDNIDNKHGLAYTSAAQASAAFSGGLASSIYSYYTAGGGLRRCLVSPMRFATQFAVFEQAKLHWANQKAKQAIDSNIDDHCGCVQLSLAEVMACAAVGGLVAGSLTYPLHQWSAAGENSCNNTNHKHQHNDQHNNKHHQQYPNNLASRIGSGFTSAVRSGFGSTMARFMPTCIMTAVSYELGCRLLHNEFGHDCNYNDEHTHNNMVHNSNDFTHTHNHNHTHDHHTTTVQPNNINNNNPCPMLSEKPWLQRLHDDINNITHRLTHSNQFDIRRVQGSPDLNNHQHNMCSTM